MILGYIELGTNKNDDIKVHYIFSLHHYYFVGETDELSHLIRLWLENVSLIRHRCDN